MAKVTVRANGTNSSPTMPPTNARGRKMATVARVAAVIGVATSLAPPMAASRKASPFWRRRYMTSTMTMLSSIRRPTAMDMAESVRMLMVIPNTHMARKPRSMLMGMDMAVTSEARTAIRNRKTTTTARAPPTSAFCTSEPMLASMKSDWSMTMVSFSPSPRSPAISFALSTTALADLTVLDPSFCEHVYGQTGFAVGTGNGGRRTQVHRGYAAQGQARSQRRAGDGLQGLVLGRQGPDDLRHGEAVLVHLRRVGGDDYPVVLTAHRFHAQ